MSPRSFARHFQATTGTTPLRWLITQRIAAAQKLLERTGLPLPEAARRTGFGSEITMRQHFATHLSTSPVTTARPSTTRARPGVDTACPHP
ncbi:helix-turn-helix domain-containing protein [Streptomyces sp. NPDC088244]|uniref:helix-turn-helix domain-containing protein n=1 Tax=Streptomyces sp. NPDC088244 TaxID=3365841 RepID=UPI0038294A2A